MKDFQPDSGRLYFLVQNYNCVSLWSGLTSMQIVHWLIKWKVDSELKCDSGESWKISRHRCCPSACDLKNFVAKYLDLVIDGNYMKTNFRMGMNNSYFKSLNFLTGKAPSWANDRLYGTWIFSFALHLSCHEFLYHVSLEDLRNIRLIVIHCQMIFWKIDSITEVWFWEACKISIPRCNHSPYIWSAEFCSQICLRWGNSLKIT